MEEAANNWKVKIDEKFEKELQELIRRRHLNEDDQLVIATWIREIEEHGPEYVRGDDKVWRDHELSGEWAGHRASSYSSAGRIIYRIEDDEIIVIVVRMTATHDYKKKRKRK